MTAPFSLTQELRIAASPELLARGCVYVISLDHIRREIGDRWPRMQEAVWMHLNNLFRQKLPQTDFYTRADETSAIVSLPSLNPEEAQICCLRIAHDLHDMMLGPPEPGALSLERAVLLPDGRIGTRPLSALCGAA